MNSDTVSASPYVVHSLGFRYRGHGGDRDGHDRWSLKDVSLEVRDGEILGLLGPNGSGKTSLLKLLGKILRPEGGSITLFGTDVRALSQRAVARLVAFVPQEHLQVFPFTVLETVLMGRYPHRLQTTWGSVWERHSDIAVARRAMRELDVDHLASRSIQEISSGERQRVMIARALAQEPRVLLLDEPTAFLDLNHQVEICRVLRMLNEECRLTVVFVSHDLNLASQYCDRLLLMEKGAIVRIGTPEEVMRRDVLERVYRCSVLVDRHPESGLPRITLPAHRLNEVHRTPQSGSP